MGWRCGLPRQSQEAAHTASSGRKDSKRERPYFLRVYSNGVCVLHHFIARRKAAELIQSQFPDNAVSEPMP
jgi:hypothetical protein